MRLSDINTNNDSWQSILFTLWKTNVTTEANCKDLRPEECFDTAQTKEGADFWKLVSDGNLQKLFENFSYIFLTFGPRILMDRNGRILKKGDLVNMNQTINGEKLFWINDDNILDVRYKRDPTRKYEYDVVGLFAPVQPFSEDIEWSIVAKQM